MKKNKESSKPIKKYCGAKTRAGTPCRRRDLWPNGRCKLHGGPSTGPRSPEGKAKSAKNGFPHKKQKPHETHSLNDAPPMKTNFPDINPMKPVEGLPADQ